jgi:hypothetical protein
VANARLLFSTNNLPGSVLIRAVTWSRFSHVDIVTGDGTVIGATAFMGVHEYPMSDRLAQSTRWALFEAPGVDAASVIAQARQRVGKAYDWLGVIGVGLHRDWQSEDKWECSEFGAKCFLDAGAPLLNPQVPVWRYVPEDLLRSPRLNFIEGEGVWTWEG